MSTIYLVALYCGWSCPISRTTLLALFNCYEIVSVLWYFVAWSSRPNYRSWTYIVLLILYKNHIFIVCNLIFSCVSMSFDPYQRHSFWLTLTFGFFFSLSTYGVNQSQTQRTFSTGSVKQAQRSVEYSTVNTLSGKELGSPCFSGDWNCLNCCGGSCEKLLSIFFNEMKWILKIVLEVINIVQDVSLDKSGLYDCRNERNLVHYS